MSAHPFRRAVRNIAATPLIWAGTWLTNRGVRIMWPDDRPAPVDDAIGKAADALAQATKRLTDAMAAGVSTKHQGKAFARAAQQFFDLRAQALGDTEYLAAREAEKQRQRESREDHDAMVRSILSRPEVGP